MTLSCKYTLLVIILTNPHKTICLLSVPTSDIKSFITAKLCWGREPDKALSKAFPITYQHNWSPNTNILLWTSHIWSKYAQLASYLGGPEFGIQPAAWLRFYIGFLSPSRQILQQYINICHNHFSSMNFGIIIHSHPTIQHYAAEKASLNNQRLKLLK
jgi:hypothetical protein